MQIVGRTWLNLVTWTCRSWSEGQHDLYFMVQWFCLTSWRLFDVCTSYFGSMNQYDSMFDLNINVGHYAIFHASVILPYILKIIWCMNNIFGIMSQYDPKFDLKINIGHYDLCFMVQWFCLISWRLFDVCTSYIGSRNQYDQMFDLKINVGHCDLYSMVQWFCLISWKLFDAWTLLFRIMSQYDPKFYLKLNIGHYVLYFTVQWFCILKTIWCMNIILWD